MGLGPNNMLCSLHFDNTEPASFCYITNQPTAQTWCTTPVICVEPVVQLLYIMHATGPALCQCTRPLLQSRAVSCAT